MMKACRISFKSRLDYQEGRADARTIMRIRQHLESGCLACQRDLDWIVDVLPVLPVSVQVVEPSVSESAMAFALRLMPARAPEYSRPSRSALIAHFLFDSLNPLGRLTAARETAGLAIHAVYRADKIDVDIWQEKSNKNLWVLMGQALPAEGISLPPPMQATLLSTQGEEQVAVLEEGEFLFETVPEGEYTLHLQWEDQDIIVSELVVGERTRQ